MGPHLLPVRHSCWSDGSLSTLSLLFICLSPPLHSLSVHHQPYRELKHGYTRNSSKVTCRYSVNITHHVQNDLCSVQCVHGFLDALTDTLLCVFVSHHQIDTWLKKSNLPRLALPSVCGYIPLARLLTKALKVPDKIPVVQVTSEPTNSESAPTSVPVEVDPTYTPTESHVHYRTAMTADNLKESLGWK